MMFKSVKTGFLAALLVGSAIIANAQKKISQGTVIYGVEYSLPPEAAAMASQLPKEQKIKFNGDIMRIDMQQGPAAIGILQNYATKTGLMLIDVPIAQMQYAVKMSKDDFEKVEASSPKFSDFKATGEKQKVGNYNAKKYTYKDDKGAAYELWATTEIELPTNFHGEQFSSVKGALLKYTVFENGVKVNKTLKSVTEDKVGPFSLEVPSGYELKTMQEIMALQGGGE